MPTERFGLWSLAMGWTHVFDQKSATLPTDPVLTFAKTGTQDFRDRGRATLSWSYAKIDATLFANYLGESLTNDSLFSDTKNFVDPQLYFNATFKYNFTDRFYGMLVGNNIFNKEPPQTGEELYPYFNVLNYDPYGREVFIEVAYVFQ